MIVLTILVIVLYALFRYFTKTFKYWEERGIKHDKPIPLFGTTVNYYLMKQSVTQITTDLYCRYPNEQVVGFFRASQPQLLIRDPNIGRRMLTTDFGYFYPRGINPPKTVVEPILRNLFFGDGDLWRLLRKRLAPAFSSGKLKAMFPLICARAERLQSAIGRKMSGEKRTLNARDLMARYTIDFIGSVGFGIEIDSLNDEYSIFRKLGIEIFDVTIPEFMVSLLKQMFPETCKKLKFTYKFERKLINLVNQVRRQRNNEPSGRNDFIDLLLECKKKGPIVGESMERSKPDGTPEVATLEMDEEIIAAQVFVFFSAGFETSSSASSFTLHQLAYNPEKQSKAQQEIDRVLAKYDNKLCYDALTEMTYLECCFKEAMRIFPSLGYLIRKCARKYTIPELNVTIDPGVSIYIPLQALHNDPEYFDKPDQFRPERFHPDEFSATNKLVYLPFGEGPRACIGSRLGLMQSLTGLAAVLSRFSVEPAPESLKHPLVEPKARIVQTIKGGLPLIFRERTAQSA